MRGQLSPRGIEQAGDGRRAAGLGGEVKLSLTPLSPMRWSLTVQCPRWHQHRRSAGRRRRFGSSLNKSKRCPRPSSAPSRNCLTPCSANAEQLNKNPAGEGGVRGFNMMGLYGSGQRKAPAITAPATTTDKVPTSRLWLGAKRYASVAETRIANKSMPTNNDASAAGYQLAEQLGLIAAKSGLDKSVVPSIACNWLGQILSSK